MRDLAASLVGFAIVSSIVAPGAATWLGAIACLYLALDAGERECLRRRDHHLRRSSWARSVAAGSRGMVAIYESRAGRTRGPRARAFYLDQARRLPREADRCDDQALSHDRAARTWDLLS